MERGGLGEGVFACVFFSCVFLVSDGACDSREESAPFGGADVRVVCVGVVCVCV